MEKDYPLRHRMFPGVGFRRFETAEGVQPDEEIWTLPTGDGVIATLRSADGICWSTLSQSLYVCKTAARDQFEQTMLGRKGRS